LNVDEIPDAVIEKIMSMKSYNSLVTVTQKHHLWYMSKLKRVSTTNQKFNDILNPDIEFTNPKNKNVIVKEISLVVGDDFDTKGTVKVFSDKVLVFENESAGDFTDVSEISIKILDGLVLKRNEKIKFFIKSSDSTKVSITAQVVLGEL